MNWSFFLQKTDTIIIWPNFQIPAAHPYYIKSKFSTPGKKVGHNREI